MKFEKFMQAGRMLDDIDIDFLLDAFKRRVLDIISLLMFKIVVWDFDGTMVEFNYNDDSLLPCRDDELYEYSKKGNIYKNVNPLKIVQYVIGKLEPEKQFVVTVSVDTVRDNKTKAITRKFPEIKPENIIHVNNSSEKNAVLEMLHKKTGKDIYFVEDTAKTILNAEEAMPFVKGIHISSFLP